jgi:hypothetical protein
LLNIDPQKGPSYGRVCNGMESPKLKGSWLTEQLHEWRRAVWIVAILEAPHFRQIMGSY